MSTSKSLKIRPYARLLTMLGDQLIKNERIAVIELIKNAYDADADWVKVIFIDFGKDFNITQDSKIIIEDNGHGMNSDVIEKHWLNPATPEKKLRKQIKETTRKGRVIQGEKGIGRFSILKLCKKIQIVSRAEGENVEHVVDYDFSKYDDEFLTENKKEKELFIDDLTVTLQTRKPEVIYKHKISLGLRKIERDPKGTRIEISDLKGSWTSNKVEMVYRDFARLESIFTEEFSSANIPRVKTFEVLIYKDKEWQKYHEDYLDKLNVLLKDRAVFRVENGIYDENKGEFRFLLNGNPKALKLRDSDLAGLSVFKKYFGTHGEVLDVRKTDCGSFSFGFFIFDFDFSPQVPAKFQLDTEDKKIIRDHRIYLYRDGIRVYPYGEPEDDWLRIDVYRGTISAGHFLSNDQVVGYVNITQKGNPKLKDKTSREGLIDEGNASEDFIALLQVILAYLRKKPYAQYRADQKNKKAHDIFRKEQVHQGFEDIRNVVKNNRKALDLVCKVEKEYQAERNFLVRRAETTEDLAGVGLSVETASHDIMAIMGKAMGSIDGIIKDTLHDYDVDKVELQKELQSLRGMLSFIEAQLKDIQLLFKSSKQRRRIIKVKEIIEKIERIYKSLLKKEHIKLAMRESGSPLVAKTTDAVLLQLFINLFDNAVYWLQTVSKQEKKIEINLDGNKGQLVFSDNGPGVSKEDAPYIFEPFYSGKGEEGRGLGLYIARQLLERNDYAIELAELKADRILNGTNFVVSFVSEDN
ncbi:MAG: ATP-binding protein [Proteobacteria bacterium]|nr:ATP-binding protein [Pseudomonadota bacterium]